MHISELRRAQYHSFKDLPLERLQTRNYSIYIIDYHWEYLFANRYAIASIGGIDPTGKHVKQIWKENPQINFEPIYNVLDKRVAGRESFELKSRSPITRRAIEISGYPLTDCYYFFIHELPDKAKLIDELKTILKRKKT